MLLSIFFFNDTATTEIYTLSLHDALPIFIHGRDFAVGIRCHRELAGAVIRVSRKLIETRDRKSTRLNSSHQIISYAVFCLKKKKLHLLYILANQKSISKHLMHRMWRLD